MSDEQYKTALLRSLLNACASLVLRLESFVDTSTVYDIHNRIVREEAPTSRNGVRNELSLQEGLF